MQKHGANVDQAAAFPQLERITDITDMSDMSDMTASRGTSSMRQQLCVFAASVLTAAALVMSVGFASAQDPFGTGPGGGPFGLDPLAPPAAAPEAAGATAPELESLEPLLKSVREFTTDDPVELTRAIQIMLNYGRPDAAREYLDRLIALDLGPEAMVELHNHFRSGLFFRIAGASALQPEGARFGDAVLEAAHAATRSDARLEQLIAQLSASDPAARRQAIVDLRDADDAGLNALVQVLAQPSRAAEHAVVRYALVELLTPRSPLADVSTTSGPIGVLVSATASDDEALRAQLFDVLGRLRSEAAIPYLVRAAVDDASSDDASSDSTVAARKALLQIVGRVPQRWEAQALLEQSVREYLAGRPIGDVDSEGQTRIWQWDDDTKSATPRLVLANDAPLVTAARLARELHLLMRDDPGFQVHYLLTRLQSEKTLAGLDQPLPAGPGTAHDEAVAAGADMTEAVLDEAIQKDKTAAAIAALEVLRTNGDVGLLFSSSGRPRRLAASLRHPDRRVRFAAAQAIVAIDPQVPFAGDSFLPEALAYFAGTSGSRRILIAHPRTDYGQSLAGLASQLGIDADTAQTGREALKLARSHPDYEWVLVSDAINDPPAGELLQQLRRDPLSGKLPVGIMARPERALAMARLTDDDPLSEAFPLPHSAAGMSVPAARLRARAGRDATSYDERMQQALIALDQAGDFAKQEEIYPFYDFLCREAAFERALSNPELAVRAARVLGYLGTPTAQRTLVTVTSQQGRSVAERKAASDAFSTAVQRRGLLLSSGDILRQYDVYNEYIETIHPDPDVVQILSDVLDTIEAPTRPGGSSEPHGPNVQDEP